MQITINTILSITEPNPDGNGYKWTLPSLLGDMLNKAEKLFGPRDMSYTILGIEFNNTGPRVWYPGDCKHIIIQLSLAVDSIDSICYQLSQETIHLLAPTGGRNANNLEEGLSICFAHEYMEKVMYRPIPYPAEYSDYKKPFEEVKPLLDNDPECIKKLRTEEPTFSKIKEEHMQRVFPNLNSETIEFLLSKF